MRAHTRLLWDTVIAQISHLNPRTLLKREDKVCAEFRVRVEEEEEEATWGKRKTWHQHSIEPRVWYGSSDKQVWWDQARWKYRLTNLQSAWHTWGKKQQQRQTKTKWNNKNRSTRRQQWVCKHSAFRHMWNYWLHSSLSLKFPDSNLCLKWFFLWITISFPCFYASADTMCRS